MSFTQHILVHHNYYMSRSVRSATFVSLYSWYYAIEIIIRSNSQWGCTWLLIVSYFSWHKLIFHVRLAACTRLFSSRWRGITLVQKHGTLSRCIRFRTKAEGCIHGAWEQSQEHSIAFQVDRLCSWGKVAIDNCTITFVAFILFAEASPLWFYH